MTSRSDAPLPCTTPLPEPVLPYERPTQSDELQSMSPSRASSFLRHHDPSHGVVNSPSHKTAASSRVPDLCASLCQNLAVESKHHRCSLNSRAIIPAAAQSAASPCG
ncbi:hypothetical protein M0R45_026596 [Rubus argutus]|uniref:Uncharacterized protein n=1 Tax=Rubus argutus TaxID=59490 RepID=A0AAW1WZP5_RUBAR